jgi:cytochrome c oxidase subunit 2
MHSARRRTSPLGIAALTVVGAGFATSALADPPLSYLTSAGPRADPVLSLTWGTLTISIAVSAIITVLVLVGVFRRRIDLPAAHHRLPVERTGSGLSWISIGMAISVVVLLGSMGWTFATMAAVSRKAAPAAMTVEITGHQWWWQVRYVGADSSRTFETANEVHIPAGRPVEFKLRSSDVIHSFWIPALGGKMDLIPGQTNTTWFEAAQPGTYRGQCTEYCGVQHAHMVPIVIADPPDRFDQWWNDQLAPAPQPQVAEGEQLFLTKCGACHAVRGTVAGGRLGPDLSHLMSRTTIGAGLLTNNPANLSGWITSPQTAKPGVQMPNIDLSGPQLTALRTYLATLK